MYPPMQVHRAIFHHCQDTGTNCGRTCAQMIISSLKQSPGPGDTFPAPPAGAPLPVGQGALQLREDQPSDTVTTPQWFTHPEEMRQLLKTATELTLSQRKWRLASHTTREALMADVLFALERGMPSIFGVYPTDHWVVMTGAFFDAGGLLNMVRMLNPLPTRLVAHTYIDLCSDKANGEGYAPWDLFDSHLASYSQEVGDVPPPIGMKSYKGKFVGIIHGTAPSKKQRDALIKRLPPPPPAGLAFAVASPVRDPARLIGEIARRATGLKIPTLDPVLRDGRVPIVRVVKDIDGSSAEYTLLSLFSQPQGSGLIAAFTPAGALLHFQFTNEARIHESLAGDPAEPLWWTRRWLPSLPNPYFPFTRKVTGIAISYTRVVDKFAIEMPLPPRPGTGSR